MTFHGTFSWINRTNTTLNPFMPSGLFYLSSLDQSISILRGAWSVLIITLFIEIPVVNANSVDPDQTPRAAASDLGLHCLSMSHLWDSRRKWVYVLNFRILFSILLLYVAQLMKKVFGGMAIHEDFAGSDCFYRGKLIWVCNVCNVCIGNFVGKVCVQNFKDIFL